MPPISCGDARRCVGFPTRNLVVPVYSRARGKEGEGGGGDYIATDGALIRQVLNGINGRSNDRLGRVSGEIFGPRRKTMMWTDRWGPLIRERKRKAGYQEERRWAVG
jgi:hypothetical protein